MKRVALFLISAVWLAAQVIPNRYIVEFESRPASAVSIAKNTRYSVLDRDVQTRRAEIQTEHRSAEQTINGLGGTVTHHYDTLVNAMAVTLSPAAAERLAQTPGVRGVYPVHRHHLFMDQAVQVHRVPQAWQTLAGGASSAGAGIKIGMLDTGIDVTHPAFQNFSTPMPPGFPIISGEATLANTNNKVIVARVYDDLTNGVDNTQSDGSDYYQHGTTTSSIAGGLSTTPGSFGIGAVSGIAPGAWIGNYKVGDDFGDLSETTFIEGLEDAFTDGMNVVNYSAGGPIESSSQESGPIPRAIANAVAGGMVVVAAMGNAGPGLGTVSTPAASAAAIAVGAIPNQRWFWFGVTLGGTQPFYAVPANEELNYTAGDVIGAVIDVSTLSSSDPAGYACSALPAGSVKGAIALIQRGGPGGVSCTFASKLNNAQNAGAIGAIIYDNTNRTFFDYTLSGYDVQGFEIAGADYVPTDVNGNPLMVTWSMGSAGLPSLMVGQADGQTIQQQIQANPTMLVDLDFDGKTPQTFPSNQVSDFSSLGPTPGANIKPDVVAVGDWLVAPLTTVYEAPGCPTPYALDLVNGCYPAYTFLDTPSLIDYYYGYPALYDDGVGTSFATPMVTGSVAVLMAARPGLTGAQYRSLVSNSSPEFDQYPTGAVAPPQLAGAGILDLLGSLQAGLTAGPTSVNFLTTGTSGGAGSSSSVVAAALHPRDASAASGGVSETVTLTNAGSATDTFAVTFNSLDGAAVPTVDHRSFSLTPGASQTITLTLPGSSSLPSGQYHGFVLINGTKGQTTLRVPYWYGVLGSAPQSFVDLYDPGTDPSGCTDSIYFRLLDAVGLPFEPSGNPSVTTTDPRAQVGSIAPLGDIAGTFQVQITTGRADADGFNTFTIGVGSTTVGAVYIQIDNSGQTSCSGSSGSAAVTARRAKARTTHVAALHHPRRSAHKPAAAPEDR